MIRERLVLFETGKRIPYDRDYKICYRASALDRVFEDIRREFMLLTKDKRKEPRYDFVKVDKTDAKKFVTTKWGSVFEHWDGITIPLIYDETEVGFIKTLFFKGNEITNFELTAEVWWYDETYDENYEIKMDSEILDMEKQINTLFVTDVHFYNFEIVKVEGTK